MKRKKIIPGKSCGEKAPLNSEFKNVITEFIKVLILDLPTEVKIGQQQLSKYIKTQDKKELLFNEITHCLSDYKYLRTYLRFLRQNKSPLLPYEDLSDDYVERLLNHGPRGLTLNELVWLTVMPEYLEALHEEIHANTTPFWTNAINYTIYT